MRTSGWQEVRFDDALETIAQLPPAQRRILCKAAVQFFRSAYGYRMMDKIGRLPDDHPRKLLMNQRLAFAVLHLLETGALPEGLAKFDIAADRWREIESV